MEKQAEFYTGEGYLRKGKDVYSVLYMHIIDLLPPPIKECPPIFDIGCGVGYFAERVMKRGYKKYVGLDFSEDMIRLASTLVPEYQYVLMSVYSDEFEVMVNNYRLFTMLETLEHMDNDREVLKKLPNGSIIVGSVPSSNAPGHVRTYKGVHDVFNRYNDIIEFNFLNEMYLNQKKPTNALTVFRGVIK